MHKGKTHFITIFFALACIAITWCTPARATQDSVVVPASTRYADVDFMTRFLTGRNYRDVWSQPVKMPVFDIDQVKGGFEIVKLGGGFQTKSLRLKDKHGTEWVLRTVDKDVTNILPSFLRNTLIHHVFQDLISAAYPYAPLTIGDMAKAVGVITANPTLYYVPDDPRMGEFRDEMAHQVCFLERREPTPDLSNAEDTEDAMEGMHKPNTRIMQDMALRARLLDMLIGDWDRHKKQWRWGVKDSGNIKVYYPIPVDRDQAYFRGTGALVRFGSLSILPHMSGFKKSTRDLIDLNFKEYSFDRFFLNRLDDETWQKTIIAFQKNLTDDVIDKAMMNLPPEIYSLSGKMLSETLKSRRDGLLKDGMRYYRYIATDVYVVGKNEPETIELTDKDDKVVLKVYKTGSANDVTYIRELNPKDTREIHLFGLQDNDTIQTSSKRIKLTKETMEAEKLL